MKKPSDAQNSNRWQPMKLPAIVNRLAEVRDLLRQAAAVGLAQDVARLESLKELQQDRGESGHPQPRRYR